ncbi:MAG: hypothetical protein ACRDRT_07130, partial [Pseudonocardiaceae bacterium]
MATLTDRRRSGLRAHRYLADTNATVGDIMSQKKPAPAPVPEEVGHHYDRFALTAATKPGDNLHAGYWDNPDSEVPPEEATDRLTDV